MSFNFINLNADIRKYMLSELENDISSGKIYYSKRLNDSAHIKYISLFKKAINEGNDSIFAEDIKFNNILNANEPRNGKLVRVPYNAATTLAEGEFNRLYMRAVCVFAIEFGIKSVVVYRARSSSNPRHESEVQVGKNINTQELLDDLRKNIGIDTYLGMPSGPNSGLSVKLI